MYIGSCEVKIATCNVATLHSVYVNKSDMNICVIYADYLWRSAEETVKNH